MPYPDNVQIAGPIISKIANRGISPRDVEEALRYGMIIERLQRGEPERYLLLYWHDDRPLHVVAA
jgi:hypothetical protein